MDSDRRRQLVILATYVVTVVVNGLAVALPLNGQTTAEISDRYPTLVTPAGYVFSIWSLIYLALLIFSVYQALPSQRTYWTGMGSSSPSCCSSSLAITGSTSGLLRSAGPPGAAWTMANTTVLTTNSTAAP